MQKKELKLEEERLNLIQKVSKQRLIELENQKVKGEISEEEMLFHKDIIMESLELQTKQNGNACA